MIYGLDDLYRKSVHVPQSRWNEELWALLEN